ETRGWSPERITTVSESRTTSEAARSAPPVPSACSWTIVSVPFGSADDRSRSGETITQILPAPASRAARIGQATIGRPQISCRTLGRSERMRVPWPAAMIRAVGASTPERVIRAAWRVRADRCADRPHQAELGGDRLRDGVGADDHGVGDGPDVVGRHADALCVPADGLGADGLVDADASQGPVLLGDHVAADPA